MNVRIDSLDGAAQQRYTEVVNRLRDGPDTEAHITFFHSWEWGEFMAQRAARLERVAVLSGDDVIGVGQLALHRDHRIAYWYSPRGLAMDYSDPQLVAAVYQALARHVRRLGVRTAFLRADPNLERGHPGEAALDRAGGKKAAIFHQAERCWVLDLVGPEEEQLAHMRSLGMRSDVLKRVKKSRKNGVTVRVSDDPADLEKLLSLLHALDEKKGGIGMHADDHYREQFARMAPAGHQRVFLAELDGQVGAANLMGLYGGEASWLHGATAMDPGLRKLSPAYQLHLETMGWLSAHRPEVKRYNFWGVLSDENYHEGHPKYGYSHFKRGFGGQKVEYVRAREFVFRPMEWALLYGADVYRTRRYQND